MSVDIRVGDAREVLRGMPDESVHCVISSPPYWGLRSYDPGMIGLEPTFDEHLENLVAVFREVRRVLRKDGTLWLNYGDAYGDAQPRTRSRRADRPASPRICMSRGGTGDLAGPSRQGRGTGTRSTRPPFGLKPKDLMMMPARVAMALQADGWWLRSEIVWHKPNPMPAESCRDRPDLGSAREAVPAEQERRYFYDAEAVRQLSEHAGVANSSASRQRNDGWWSRTTTKRIPGAIPKATPTSRNVWTKLDERRVIAVPRCEGIHERRRARSA